jgi:lipopolysaccharide/colanic/teichoic acid biosynthesis glycosyltransferase/glycosyltransferase involved in cell wall biosynthesis
VREGRPLRICFFNRAYHPDESATARLLTDLAEDLAAGGDDVWVVAGPPLSGARGDGTLPAGRAPRSRRRARAWSHDLVSSPPMSASNRASSRRLGAWSHDLVNGVHVVRARGTALAPVRFAARAANYVSYFAAAWLAARSVPRPDVVVALTDPPIVGLAAASMARRSGARFVFVCQDVFPEVARLVEGFRSPRLERALERVTRSLVARADRVVAVGETMRDHLIAAKGADPGRVVVIHNWADCSAIVPGRKRNAWSAAHGLDDRFVVMHAGNVGLSQQLAILIDAAGGLAADPAVLVVIIGDGVKRRALEEAARARRLPNVRFLPFQPRARLSDVFAAADVFVVSLARGLAGAIVPSKLYGILAAGRPYVAAVEEVSEVVAITRAHGTGLVCAPGDADDLVRQIRAIRADPALAAKLGANGRRAALRFDRRAQVAAYARLFRELAALPCPPPLRLARAKRAFDVALAGAGLVGSLPLWAAIAAAIALDDGGPVFYGQERVGQGGRRFTSWKFRSMAVDADRRLAARQAQEHDARVTRVGRLLRAMALDELPQLWNILIGDMSFVGPRPLLPEEIEVRGDGTAVPLAAIPGYEARQRAVPGLTGLAQVYAPRDIPRRQKFRLDRLYVARQSFWLDVRLIALSFWITFRARWEHRGPKV